MTDIVVASQPALTIFDLGPQQMVNEATKMANVLKDVIEKQNLYTLIQGKKYVRVDAWATLGVMIGILPREVSVTEKENGDYEAVVELYSVKTGSVVGRGSALCGIDEKRWGGADRFARRSMAITRATGKAYRLGFAWVMGLAGYQGTPLEEMDGVFDEKQEPDRPTPSQEKTRSPKKVYDATDAVMQDTMARSLEKRSIPSAQWDVIGEAMHGRPVTDLDTVIKQVITEPL